MLVPRFHNAGDWMSNITLYEHCHRDMEEKHYVTPRDRAHLCAVVFWEAQLPCASHSCKNSRRSKLWLHFFRLDAISPQCNICMQYITAKSGNTSNLMEKHFEQKVASCSTARGNFPSHLLLSIQVHSRPNVTDLPQKSPALITIHLSCHNGLHRTNNVSWQTRK